MTDQWAALQRLLGRWEGTASGKPGMGSQVRRYESILRGAFIMGTNKTHWQPTEAEPDGEAHEDLCLLSHDRATGQAVMRSFFVEGFVCEYRCVEASADGTRLVFEAGSVENGPIGMRARETFVFSGTNEVESTFELAQGDGAFTPYTTERLTRVGD
jgi:hypothetical protein